MNSLQRGAGMKLLSLYLCLLCCATGKSNPYEVSDHFDGNKFYNLDGVKDKSFIDLIRWQWTRQSTLWPLDLTPPTSYPLPVTRLDSAKASYTFINHSTVLLQIDGLNIITDPMFSERASPVSFAGPKRHRKPGVELEQLPPIDLILLSHNHYDHMDRASLVFLAQRDQPFIVTGLGNGNLLRQWGFKNVAELDWFQKLPFKNHEIHFVPAQHFSARGIGDRNKTLWGGFVFKSSRGYIYFAGDTGWGDFIYEIGKQFQPVVLSLIPIGAYEPRWFMKDMHMNPGEAWQVHHTLQSQYSLGIHWGTFQLTDEGWDQPVTDLKRIVTENIQKNSNPFVVSPEGQSIRLW